MEICNSNLISKTLFPRKIEALSLQWRDVDYFNTTIDIGKKLLYYIKTTTFWQD